MCMCMYVHARLYFWSKNNEDQSRQKSNDRQENRVILYRAFICTTLLQNVTAEDADIDTAYVDFDHDDDVDDNDDDRNGRRRR